MILTFGYSFAGVMRRLLAVLGTACLAFAAQAAPATVARIGETGYPTLNAAFAAVKDGETITLVVDAALEAPVTVSCAATLALNGRTLDAAGQSIEVSGALTFEGDGTVTGGFGTTAGFVSVLPEGLVSVKGGSFIGNSSAEFGGVFNVEGGELVIDGGTFAENGCDYCGGVIYSCDGNVTVNGGLFVDNDAEYGGVVCLDSDSLTDVRLTIGGGTFEGNSSNSGGVVNVYPSEKLQTVSVFVAVSNAVFVSNVAEYGGAIYLNENAETTVMDAVFRQNSDSLSAGAIYNEGFSLLTVGGSTTFVANVSTNGGSVFYNDGMLILQDGVIISNNVGALGAVCNYGTLSLRDNARIVDNRGSTAGAVYCEYVDAYYPGICRLSGGCVTGNGSPALVNVGGEFVLGAALELGESVETAGLRCDLETGDTPFALEGFVPKGQVFVRHRNETDSSVWLVAVTNAVSTDQDRYVACDAAYRVVFDALDGTLALANPSDSVALGCGLTALLFDAGLCRIVGAGELNDVSALRGRAVTNLIVGTGVMSIGASVFDGWRTLRDVSLGAGCTNVGKQAFLECYNLTNVTSTAAALKLGDHAFCRCNSLEELTIAATPVWGRQTYEMQAGIYMQDGLPVIYAIPRISVSGYRLALKGSNDLATWVNVVSEADKRNYHFFKLTLEVE